MFVKVYQEKVIGDVNGHDDVVNLLWLDVFRLQLITPASVASLES